MEIIKLNVAELSNDPANARTHNDRNIESIMASLRRFGQQKPIVIDRNKVVRAGNGTLEAARRLSWETIDCVESQLSGSEATAYAIADNRSAELAEWDSEILTGTLDGLAQEDKELFEATGFNESELDKMLAQLDREINIDEDDVPDVPDAPRTNKGDLWALGQHRLYCGDCTLAENYTTLMDGEKADMILTDPPYNVDYTGGSGKKIANDSMEDAKFLEFLTASFVPAFKHLHPGGSFYIWHADSEGLNFRLAVRNAKQKVRQCLIWKKNSLVLGRQDYQWQHEPCLYGWGEEHEIALYGWRDGGSHGWYADRKQTTVLNFDRPKQSEEHPTMKPVKLFAYLIGNSCAPRGLVLDPFLGSGTSIIAAEELGRRCFGFELDPGYCDVIVERWQKLTNRQAELVYSGSEDEVSGDEFERDGVDTANAEGVQE